MSVSRNAVVGVLIAACPTTIAAQERPAVVSLLESSPLTIGPDESRPETLFTGIVGAVLLPGGDLAVADGGAHVIRIFDASGAHRRSIGREGEGPGEFRGLRWIGPCDGGNLMAVDAILGRLTILSARDARAVRTLPLPGGVRFDRYLMCEQGEHLIVLVDRPRRLGERGKVTRFPAALVRVAVGSATQETLGELPGTDYYFASRVDGYVDVPLGARAAAAANGRHVYFAQTDHAMVQVIELESGRRRSFAHGLARPDVSPAAWDAATEARVDIEPLTRTRELLRRVLEEVPMPEQQPPFVDMKVDRAGRLWLRLPSLGASATWRVLNPTGRHVGTVLLPSNVEPLDIGNRHVVAVARDSMGVQSVLVYSFSRPLLSQ